MIPTHSLVFGSITMVDQGDMIPDSNGVTYNVRPTDTNWGNASPVTVAVLSLLKQGSLVAYDHTENREPVLRVTIQAEDSQALALGERALQLECQKANTLTWVPPDGAGQPTVFDIVWSQMELDFDHQDELLWQRTYLIKMQALPYGRAAALTMTAAQGTSTETVIDSCGSTTGWSFSQGTSLVTSAGTIVVTSDLVSTVAALNATDTVTVSFAADPYLKVRWKTSTPLSSGLGIYFNGSHIYLPEVSRVDGGSGYTESYFAVGSITAVTSITFRAAWYPVASTQTLTIDTVSRYTSLPVIGTNKQKAMALVPRGSVNAQGSISVSHASSALGKTIVFTHPSGTGYLPPLSVWRTSGDARSADAAAISGNTATLTGVTTWRVPQPNLPSGRVEVWAWLKASATTTFTMNWSLFSYMGSTALSADAYSISLSLPSTYALTFLGAAVMPPVALGPAGFVAVQMQASGAGTPLVSWDEVYLFATDQGRLTVVDCGTASPAAGGSSNRLWIDAPDPTQPMGGIWRGNAADRSDQWHAGPQAQPWEVHEFAPTGSTIFVATPNAADASTSLTHYRRYQTYVANEG